MTHRIKYTDETLTYDKSGDNFKRFFADVYNFTLMRRASGHGRPVTAS